VSGFARGGAGALRFDHRIYGLTLRANRRLPHVVRARRLEELPDLELGFAAPYGNGSLQLVTYGDAAAGLQFAIEHGGRRLWVDWLGTPRVKSVSDATALLVGPVLGGLLWSRDMISLHGSVVAIGQHAVALLGDAGIGKSTLAASLAQRGHAVLSDDVAAFTERADGRWWVQPGYPRLRLEPRALRTARRPDAGAVMTGSNKRYIALSARADARSWRFASTPCPLGAVYELRRGHEVAQALTASVMGADRVALLLRYVRPPVLPPDPAARARDFERLGRLAKSIPVRRLAVPEGLASVGAVCDALVQNVATVVAE
jgi:hypothetical protein